MIWIKYGYLEGRYIPSGWAAVTSAVTGNGRLIVCDDENIIVEAYCYSSMDRAREVLSKWDGISAPPEWMKNVFTGQFRKEYSLEQQTKFLFTNH